MIRGKTIRTVVLPLAGHPLHTALLILGSLNEANPSENGLKCQDAGRDDTLAKTFMAQQKIDLELIS
jgi:hypothetical protein